jgi:adenosylmethionine-8-amino-7-oxononanoate aminotransferase
MPDETQSITTGAIMHPQALWYPYAQMKNLEINHEVVSAKGVTLQLANGQSLIDAVASWWCVIHGYNHPKLNSAVTEQLHNVAHVMLGGLKNRPADELAQKLVDITPEGLNHVFFSDSGSVGVEVALKMAIQYWQNQGKTQKQRILTLKKAYHGDTTGCMSVSDCDEGMHHMFNGVLMPQIFAPQPCHGSPADEAKLNQEIEALSQLFEQHHQELAAFIVEPLVQGAGGFNIYSERYLKAAKALCKQYQVLLIFDEVATGFGRTGEMFAAAKAQVTPDIMVLSKGLTAGYLSHAATLATTQVFNGFYDDDASKAFMHGPTYMGNPLACAVALAGIELFEQENYLQKINDIEKQLKRELLSFTHPSIREVRVLGAIAVIEVHDASSLKGIQDFAANRGVWLRPFENYLYTMPAYIIKPEELSAITQAMTEWFLNE